LNWPLTARAFCLCRLPTAANIYEFTPVETQSTFASGLSYTEGLAFNSGGRSVCGWAAATSLKSRRGGAQSTFASDCLILLTGL